MRQIYSKWDSLYYIQTFVPWLDQIVMFHCFLKWSSPKSQNFMHHMLQLLTYHEYCDLNIGLWRTNLWLGVNLYGVRDVTHRGPQGLTAFWPSVCPLGRSIIHVGVMHLSLWLCIENATKRSSVGEWQAQLWCILWHHPPPGTMHSSIPSLVWKAALNWGPCCIHAFWTQVVDDSETHKNSAVQKYDICCFSNAKYMYYITHNYYIR